MSWSEAGQLISVSVLVSCTWRRLGERGREMERRERPMKVMRFYSVTFHCIRDNLNEKIWDLGRVRWKKLEVEGVRLTNRRKRSKLV